MNRRVLLATHNPAKVKRFKTAGNIDGVELVAPKDIELGKVEAVENGDSEKANAKIKSMAYYQASGLPSLSLDTGFYIHGLPADKQPGRHVQRVAGVDDDTSDEDRFNKMSTYYMSLAKSFGGSVEAYFLDVFCLYDGQKEMYIEARRPALLTDSYKVKDVHLPIASLYKVPQFDKYYHDLSPAELDEYVKPSIEAVKQLLKNWLV